MDTPQASRRFDIVCYSAEFLEIPKINEQQQTPVQDLGGKYESVTCLRALGDITSSTTMLTLHLHAMGKVAVSMSFCLKFITVHLSW